LVDALVSNDWTVDDARKAAQKFKGVEAPPEWRAVDASCVNRHHGSPDQK
jgi:hypothetical protein